MVINREYIKKKKYSYLLIDKLSQQYIYIPNKNEYQ